MTDYLDPRCVDCQKPIPAVVPMLDRPPLRCDKCEDAAHPPVKPDFLRPEDVLHWICSDCGCDWTAYGMRLEKGSPCDRCRKKFADHPPFVTKPEFLVDR